MRFFPKMPFVWIFFYRNDLLLSWRWHFIIKTLLYFLSDVRSLYSFWWSYIHILKLQIYLYPYNFWLPILILTFWNPLLFSTFCEIILFFEINQIVCLIASRYHNYIYDKWNCGNIPQIVPITFLLNWL